MPEIVYGERVGQGAILRLTVAAVIVNEAGEVLLARRKDSDLWGVPGGKVEAGESVSEAVVREVQEETGISIEIVRMTAVYSDPNRVIAYSDGRRTQIVNLAFLCHPTSLLVETTTINDPDTSEVRYFALNALPSLLDQHERRIADALHGSDVIIA